MCGVDLVVSPADRHSWVLVTRSVSSAGITSEDVTSLSVGIKSEKNPIVVSGEHNRGIRHRCQ